ncbi:hypothetical protein SAMN05444397_102417 [Flavobacterium aquidurense]|uniref:Tetratricopeptide repeat-containing protein n=1 Tax=Flavobacterium frigidimaris TaxID=262320 RepID=A0ABX4BMN6_FLAFR|nr:hypothetical protein [Flavobacterium frigidimaris]OXA77671.1 hypothetical protein B0A65_15135 [Flavobacterium frigidimaris]SDY84952.1 hypothetical protein SAMN05444397_102417 [Flavobacterium aquidurense]
MKKSLIFLVLLFSCTVIAQSDPKVAFQKTRYELAVSCYKKADFVKALDLFSIASKIKPENELGKESIKKVDTLKTMLRKSIMDKVIGSWKMNGNQPLWSVNATNTNDTDGIDELVEINQKQILFYEVDTKTKAKKLIKTEDIKYYNKEESDALFSAIILSDGTIWNCSLNEDSDILHVINIARQTENGVEKIKADNLERFYSKVN